MEQSRSRRIFSPGGCSVGVKINNFNTVLKNQPNPPRQKHLRWRIFFRPIFPLFFTNLLAKNPYI
jgi:hypothetical protein